MYIRVAVFVVSFFFLQYSNDPYQYSYWCFYNVTIPLSNIHRGVHLLIDGFPSPTIRKFWVTHMCMGVSYGMFMRLVIWCNSSRAKQTLLGRMLIVVIVCWKSPDACNSVVHRVFLAYLYIYSYCILDWNQRTLIMVGGPCQ